MLNNQVGKHIVYLYFPLNRKGKGRHRLAIGSPFVLLIKLAYIFITGYMFSDNVGILSMYGAAAKLDR